MCSSQALYKVWLRLNPLEIHSHRPNAHVQSLCFECLPHATFRFRFCFESVWIHLILGMDALATCLREFVFSHRLSVNSINLTEWFSEGTLHQTYHFHGDVKYNVSSTKRQSYVEHNVSFILMSLLMNFQRYYKPNAQASIQQWRRERGEFEVVGRPNEWSTYQTLDLDVSSVLCQFIFSNFKPEITEANT